MKIALNIVLFIPLLLIKLILWIIGGVLWVIIFALRTVTGVTYLLTVLLGSLLALLGIFSIGISIFQYDSIISQYGKSQIWFQIIFGVLIITVGGLIISLPLYIEIIYVEVPSFFFELGARIPLIFDYD